MVRKKIISLMLLFEVLDMARGYMRPHKKYMSIRKYNGKCEGCGQPKPSNEIYCYVDGDNYAISYHSPYLCINCYIKKYGRNKNENN